MNTLTVSQDVAKLLPQMHLVVVTARNLNNKEINENVTKYVEVCFLCSPHGLLYIC